MVSLTGTRHARLGAVLLGHFNCFRCYHCSLQNPYRRDSKKLPGTRLGGLCCFLSPEAVVSVSSSRFFASNPDLFLAPWAPVAAQSALRFTISVGIRKHYIHKFNLHHGSTYVWIKETVPSQLVGLNRRYWRLVWMQMIKNVSLMSKHYARTRSHTQFILSASVWVFSLFPCPMLLLLTKPHRDSQSLLAVSENTTYINAHCMEKV